MTTTTPTTKNTATKQVTDATMEKAFAMLAFIRDHIQRKNYAPTYEEIRRGLGLSTKSLVDYRLNVLESLGLIQRDPDMPRGIKLTENSAHPSA